MRRREIEERLDSVEELLDRVDRSIEKIEMVTVVREPNTAISADAYNGLRKQVIASASERAAHLNQLAQFDASLRAGATTSELASLVREWSEQASLETVDDASQLEAFEVVGPEGAPAVRVLRPAYVDARTGRVVRAGLAERTDDPFPADAPREEKAPEIPSTTSGGAR